MANQSSQSLPLPLNGVRVADFTWIIAGPQATRILADLGAEVIKVESESSLDAVRGAAGLHNNFNRNKLGITANIHHPRGREVVERLIAASDIVIENFSSGTFARMGFPYERLVELRPDIIYISLSGYGQVGRDAGYGTWGPTAQGASGLTAMSGLTGHPPAGWGYSYLDHTAGFYGATAALMALWHRRQTGEGQHIDMSQVETGMVLAGVPMLDAQVNGRAYEPVGNRSRWPSVAPHGIYPCYGEDRWIAIAVERDEEWPRLCEVLGARELAGEPRFRSVGGRLEARDEIDERISARTRLREARELADELQRCGVVAGVCQTIEDRMERDDQLAARGFYPRSPHPEFGDHRFEGFPMQFSRARWRVDRGAPLVGEHTRQVLRDLLGYAEAEIEAMAAEAAI
jgi:crotonobetainyl-CoA:carnitine CoA-transferase CaiB-like acyl-CoA transferase